MTPLLKWVGGKTKLLPEICKRMPKQYRTYYEPFFGGGALFFHQRPKFAVVNDMNPDLANFYNAAAADPDKLARSIHHAFFPRRPKLTLRTKSSKQALYTRNRDLFNAKSKSDSIFRRAALFYFLNRTCFNGLYRVNRSGDFNVPMGDYQDWGKLFNREAFHAGAIALRTAKIRSGNYWLACSEAQDGDFVYFDPPYDPISETASFTGYTAGGFTRQDQEELEWRASTLVQQGAAVMLSNADTPFIRKLFRKRDVGWKLARVTAPRALNCKGNRRGNVGELIITGGY